jgi:hypothetical protein
MFLPSMRDHVSRRPVIASVLVAFVSLFLAPSLLLAQAQPASQTPEERAANARILKMRDLRMAGDYEQVIPNLVNMIREYRDSETILRKAYNLLVAVLLFDVGDEAAAEARAREALTAFSDLTVDEANYPKALNDFYDGLRRQMFGWIVISEPREASVFIAKKDDDTESLLGVVPKETTLTTGLLPIGEYELRFAKSGHMDKSKDCVVLAGLPTPVAETLEQERGRMWWVYRIGGGAVAVLATVLLLGGGGDDGGGTEPEPEPLPGPPAPPTN